MLTTIIKYLFIYFFCLFICRKSLPMFKLSNIINCVISATLAMLTYFLSIPLDISNYIIPLFILWIVMSVISLQPQLSYIAITISFMISFCIHVLSSILALLLLFPFYRALEAFPFPFYASISGIIQSFLMLLIFKIKRFRRGIPFLNSSIFITVATLLCLIFTGLVIYVTLDFQPLHIRASVLISFLVFLAFLIYWWQAQITKSYRRSLELRELESLRTEVVEKDILIQKLLKENDRLATITHRDNTLISTLTNSTCNYLMTDYANPAVAIEARDSLIANIKKLSDGRLTLPDGYNEKKARNFETGFSLMNDMLHNMDEDAIKKEITFSVHVGVMLKDFVPQDISEMDLVHLVDDLLKNAFKATKTSEPRVVQLQFYKVGKHFVVEVADSGIPFEVKSLVNMGIEKMTTYEDGSGIGLMDIWKTKENCRATYHIEEYDTPAPFTKKISLTFDGKNRYSIRTSRKDEILQMSKRADLQVYGYEE